MIPLLSTFQNFAIRLMYGVAAGCLAGWQLRQHSSLADGSSADARTSAKGSVLVCTAHGRAVFFEFL